MATGLCTDERFLGHEPPGAHPERPQRASAILRALEQAGLVERTVPVAAREATRAELELVHDPGYLDALEGTVGQGGSGWLDPDTYWSEGTWTATRLAAGGTLDLADRVLRGELSSGFAVVRPPGHHATRDRAMGFCLVNHVALAAEHLRQGGARVAIVDWDVHHGNGTEEIFAEEPDVLYVSIHEWPQYPGTGAAGSCGAGRGRGATMDLPLPAGTEPEAYLEVFRSEVAPALERFRPDLILVSAGFDAHRDDPIGGLRLDDSTYAELTRRLCAIQPRVVMVLEGGYDLDALSRSVVGVVAALVGAGAKKLR